MKSTSGYKGMLRNRLPTLVNYALKWQKAKERWIDHVYKNFISIYTDKEERKQVTYLICKEEDFVKTIDWDNLIAKQYDPKNIDRNNDSLYWKRESTWDTIFVLTNWFVNNYESIKDTYESSRSAGIDEFNIKITLINSHLRLFLPSKNANEEKKQQMYRFVDDLVDFLINCFEGRIHGEDMFNVFSNITKMSDKIRTAQSCAGALYTMTLLRGDEDEPLYMLKPKAVYVLTWINKNILYELPNVKYTPGKKGKYIDVRIRIATSMLNKLVDDGIIDKDISIAYHQRLITNVRKILSEINAEDLPF